MSVVTVLAAVVVAGLSPRPAGLTGPQPRAYAAWLGRRVMIADQAFGAAPCPTAELRSLSGSPIPRSEQAQTSAGAQAEGPALLERVRVTGCGRSIVHNLQVTPLGRGRWEGVGLLPGEPRSTPRQQNAAMQPMAAAALNGAPPLPCSSTQALRSMSNGEVRVTASGPAGWSERWPLRLCGVDRTVEIRFTPAGEVAAVTPAWPG